MFVTHSNLFKMPQTSKIHVPNVHVDNLQCLCPVDFGYDRDAGPGSCLSESGPLCSVLRPVHALRKRWSLLLSPCKAVPSACRELRRTNSAVLPRHHLDLSANYPCAAHV
jgi:hypothetical protein